MEIEADRQRLLTRRALVVGGVQIGLFGVLAARLWQLQVEEGVRYADLAEDNRVNLELTVPPRGRVFDRRGRPLALNAPTYRLRIVREQTPDLRGTLARIARLVPVPDNRLEDVERTALSLPPFVPVVVRDDLTWDEVARIAVHIPELPGVVLDQGLVRRYPHGQLLAHILGYVGPVSEQELANDPDPLLQLPEFRIGKSGVERSYDRVLRGRAGRSRIEVNALGRKIRELYREEGEPGEDIELAIDLELQSWCFDRLAAEKAAAAVVLDVHTGGVLAAVSVPSFDPRPFANGIDARSWRSLLENPLHPLVDKCIRGQYPPGSTFKMITALAALEAGVTGPGYEVYCPGFVELGNTRFHCWKEGGHGTLSLVEAIEQSCDVYFYDLARRVGVDAIAAMAQRFGLGERLGIDLPGEKPGIVPTREWKRQRFGTPWQKGETLVVGIGQGYVLATPLQLAVMTARLCNGGRAVIPWIARRARPEANDPSGAAWPSLGISEASLRPVLRGMLEVVNGRRGTARAARLELEGVRLAGKTGTSQVRRITRAERLVGAHKRKDIPWEERDHALFVCFAPYDEPRYAVAVVVEHGGSGAKAAAPIARDIMMRTLEIDPAGRRLADLRAGVPG